MKRRFTTNANNGWKWSFSNSLMPYICKENYKNLKSIGGGG
jgi:hypothetical protein